MGNDNGERPMEMPMGNANKYCFVIGYAQATATYAGGVQHQVKCGQARTGYVRADRLSNGSQAIACRESCLQQKWLHDCTAVHGTAHQEHRAAVQRAAT